MNILAAQGATNLSSRRFSTRLQRETRRSKGVFDTSDDGKLMVEMMVEDGGRESGSGKWMKEHCEPRRAKASQ